MTGQELDAAVLQARVNDSGAPWRQLGTEFDNPYAAALVQMHGMYRWVRSEFPDLVLGAEAMNVLADEFVGGSWLCARELPISGSSVRCDGLRAAAELGGAGQLEAVLVSCAILSHGFDYHGGDSPARPLIDDYRYLLPAVASYFSAHTGEVMNFEDLDVPRWVGAGRSLPESIEPNALARALNPTLAAPVVAPLLAASPTSCSPDQALAYLYYPAALALSRDLSALDVDARASAEEELALVVEELAADWPEDDPDVSRDFYLAPLELALMVAQDFAGLLNGVDCDSINTRLDEWANESWSRPDAWPDSLEDLKSAIRDSPWVASF